MPGLHYIARMRATLRLAALLAVPVLAIAGCGGSDDGSSSSATPQERLKESAAALAKVKGFHFEGTGTDEDGASELEGDARADGSLRIVLRQRGEAEVRTVGGKGYVRADKEYWTANADAKTAAVLADKWVVAPAETFGAAELARFEPATLAYCLTKTEGAIKDGGEGEVDGTAVAIITSVGDAPGSSPGSISIAAEGEAYPLRAIQEGPRKPGGTVDPRCEDEDDSTTKSDIKLSDFGASEPIEAPADAIDLDSLKGGDDTTS